MRTVKTAICVAVCLLIDYLCFNTFTLYSSVAAIVCLQSSIENTIKSGLSRLLGSVIGGAAGLAVLPLLAINENIYLILVPAFVIGVIYLCNAIKRPGAATICAIVFISIALVTKYGTDPFIEAFYCIVETVIGIVIATVINRFIFPAALKEPRVYAKTKSFKMLKEALKDKLLGYEALLMFEDFDEKAKKTRHKAKGLKIHIPVPSEYVDSTHIHAAFIDTDLRITRMTFTPRDGYITISSDLMPATLVWQEKVVDK